jgi:hypothetical protein
VRSSLGTMRRLGAAATVCLVVLAGCSSGGGDARGGDVSAATGSDPASSAPAPGTSRPTPDHAGHSTGQQHRSRPLRAGERFVDVAMPDAYSPKAPTYGTDDYRCFLLDPHLTRRSFVTGVDVVPGRPDLVHHVILFHVGPGDVAAAEAKDAEQAGQGWTCFGGTGLAGDVSTGLESAPWLAAWAPGGGEQVMARDVGIPLARGSRIIMQVHYNLLAGSGEDRSTARLRVASGEADLEPLETLLLPAPVELPCRPGHGGELCDREAAVLDVMGRFGDQAGFTVAGLQLLCGGNVEHPIASAVQTCDRSVNQPGTIRAVAGHMHLLGRSIKIELNPGRPDERTLLDIPVWDFDDQGAVPLDRPAEVEAGDILRVTCRHDQALRDLLPSFEDQPERYVVWGEGTTDEMCLGIVLLTRR